MGVRTLRWLALLSYSVMEIGGLWIMSGGAIASPDRNQRPPDGRDVQIAQSDSGCRQTNATTGVYEQPNLDSASRGILPLAQIVRLELLGTGTGWARINQPMVGWIEAKYLTPNASCNGLGESTAPSATLTNTSTSRPAQIRDLANQSSMPTPMPSEAEGQSSQPQANSFPSPDLPNLRSNRPANAIQPSVQAPGVAPSARTSSTQITTVSCDVLPTYGLIVRREATVVGDTYLTTIPAGTYQFQFTRSTQTNETPEGTRRWVYITAPVEGWISLGYVGKDFNLGGRECG